MQRHFGWRLWCAALRWAGDYGGRIWALAAGTAASVVCGADAPAFVANALGGSEPGRPAGQTQNRQIHRAAGSPGYLPVTARPGRIVCSVLFWIAQAVSGNRSPWADLGQLFTLLTAFNWIVLGPRFARIGKEKLRPLYLKTVGIAGGVATLAAGAALRWPGPLLWLIGPKYAGIWRVRSGYG